VVTDQGAAGAPFRRRKYTLGGMDFGRRYALGGTVGAGSYHGAAGGQFLKATF
jgi:hypothetical protein